MSTFNFDELDKYTTDQLINIRNSARREVNDVENHRNRLKAEILFLQQQRLKQNATNRKLKTRPLKTG